MADSSGFVDFSDDTMRIMKDRENRGGIFSLHEKQRYFYSMVTYDKLSKDLIG